MQQSIPERINNSNHRYKRILSCFLAAAIFVEGPMLHAVEKKEERKIFIKEMGNDIMANPRFKLSPKAERKKVLKTFEMAANKYAKSRKVADHTASMEAYAAAKKIIKPGHSELEKLIEPLTQVESALDLKNILIGIGRWEVIQKRRHESGPYAKGWTYAKKQLKKKKEIELIKELEKVPVRAKKKKLIRTEEKPEPIRMLQNLPKPKSKLDPKSELKKADSAFTKWMRRRGFDKLELRINVAGTGTPAKKSGDYDALLDFSGPSKRMRIGLRGLHEDEYGVSYELLGLGWHNDLKNRDEEVEIWAKDTLADFLDFGGVKRVASIRWALNSVDPDMADVFGYVSAETGTGSYIYRIGEGRNSTSLQINGGPSTFSAIYEKSRNIKFSEYSEGLAAFEAIRNAYEAAGALGDASAGRSAMLKFPKGPMILKLDGAIDRKGNKYKTTDSVQRGSTHLFTDSKGNDIRMILSAPYLEKAADGNPEIKVTAYYVRKLKNREEYINNQEIPIYSNTSIGFKIGNESWIGEAEIRPSQEALADIRAELGKLSYEVTIDEGTVIPMNPAESPTYLYRNAKNIADYQIKINEITLESPLLTATPKLFANITVTKADGKSVTDEVEITVDELARPVTFLVEGVQIKLKVSPPRYYVSTGPSLGWEKDRISLRNTSLTSRDAKVPDFVRQEISLNRTGMILPLLGRSSIGISAQFLSEKMARPAAREQREKSTSGETRKIREVGKERESDIEAITTALSLKPENMLGFTMNAVNAKGHGVWAVGLNEMPLIRNNIFQFGNRKFNINARTKRLGWDQFGTTGGTIFDSRRYGRETDLGAESIERLRSETGAAMFNYFDTYALHGEAQTGGASVTERRTVGVTKVMASGTALDSVFRAFDPGRPGFQVLAIDYHTESLKGKKDRSVIRIDRSRGFYDVGITKETLNPNFRKVYGRSGIRTLHELRDSEEGLFSPTGSISLREAFESSTFEWNPRVGITGRKGAYEARYRGLTQTERTRAERIGGLTTIDGRLKEDAYALVARGVPLFEDRLEIDGLASGTWTNRDRKTIDTLSRDVFTNTSNTRYEITPIFKTPKYNYYLRLTTELFNSEEDEWLQNVIQRKSTVKRRKLSIEPGLRSRNGSLELRATFSTESERTANEYIDRMDEIYFKQTKIGLSALGNLGKGVKFRGNVGYLSDNQGNSSYYGNVVLSIPISINILPKRK